MTKSWIERVDGSWIGRVRDWMRQSGTSQESLARALGCTRGAVGHYLAGRRNPTLIQIEHIANVMEVHPAWLLYGIESVRVGEDQAVYRVAAGGGVRLPILGNTATGPRVTPSAFIEVPGLPSSCYALTVTGGSGNPRAYDGEILVLSTEPPPQPGDEVLVRFNNGEADLFELVSTRGGRPTLGTLGDRSRRRLCALGELELMHRVVAVLRRDAVLLRPANP